LTSQFNAYSTSNLDVLCCSTFRSLPLTIQNVTAIIATAPANIPILTLKLNLYPGPYFVW
jgi:hypothetical protein